MRSQVVVTGVAGFIGSHLAERLLDEGYRVVGIDAFTPYYDPADKRENLAGLLHRPGFVLIEADLASLDLDVRLRGAEAVFHQAGQPGVRCSWGEEFERYVHHNILATQRLLEACVRAEVPRIVAASSSSVYGDAPTYPTSEDASTEPVSPYGVTKLASERLCLAYAQAAPWMSMTVLRYFTVYGPRQRPDMAFRRFFEAAYADRPIRLLGDGEQTRDFTFVGDAVRANLLAMQAPAGARTVNVGGGRRASLNQVLDLVAQVSGRRLRILRGLAEPGDVRHTSADGTRAATLLGYQPEVDLAAGLELQAAWVAHRRGLGPGRGVVVPAGRTVAAR